MPRVFQDSRENLEYAFPHGLGSRREGVLVELFVLTESGDLVGVFSTREKLVGHVTLCPTTAEFTQSPDGIKTEERLCNYRTQRVVLDTVLSDA